MKKIYACLCGEWHCLNDDENCVMGINQQSPTLWYEEGAPIAVKELNNKTIPDNRESYYNMDYIHIHYRGKDYRINPIFIQVVTD